MRIRFGWSLDRAPWQSQVNTRSGGTTGTRSSGTTVVTGPLGLLGILQTRLGTTRPTIDRPIRIAQYRSLLAQADHPWYRRSFANDPWNTAHHLLELRDDAIEAGWKPATDGQDYFEHPRLDALATVESLVVTGSLPHDAAATLAPGRADDVRESLELLRLYGASWPLEIDSIELRDKRDILPQVWQDILGAVEVAGVTVTEAEAPTEMPKLTIVRGPDTWSTAEAAARYLANVNDRERICILAGDATAVLDQQLARRQAPTLGIADSNAANPSAQILPVFLGAALPPTDIRRVAELLHLSFGTIDATSSATSLVPRGVSSVLLQALTQEPGISSDPESAWMRALDQLKSRTAENSDTAIRAWETTRALDGFLRTRPPAVDSDELDLDSLNPALDWLATRLRRLNGNRTADTTQDDINTLIAEAATHLASFRTAITRLGTTPSESASSSTSQNPVHRPRPVPTPTPKPPTGRSSPAPQTSRKARIPSSGGAHSAQPPRRTRPGTQPKPTHWRNPGVRIFTFDRERTTETSRRTRRPPRSSETHLLLPRDQPRRTSNSPPRTFTTGRRHLSCRPRALSKRIGRHSAFRLDGRSVRRGSHHRRDMATG